MKNKIILLKCHHCKTSHLSNTMYPGWTFIGTLIREAWHCKRCYETHLPDRMLVWDGLDSLGKPPRGIDEIVRDHIRFVRYLYRNNADSPFV